MIKKRVLVTGGAGFVGSHLCERLLAQDCFVICLDNFFTGSENNLTSIATHPHFSFVKHDVCLPFLMEVDEIYNLACPASPIHYQQDPVRTAKTGVLGALNMLECARQCGAKILQASTSEVYGDPLVHPQVEEYWGNVNPVGIRSCYDESKRCAETLFFDYYRQYKVPIKIGRIFNTYGPRMHPEDGRVVSNFIVQALKKQPLTIYGDGSQTRSFCYVDDLVDGLMALMEAAADVTGPINLGNPVEFQIKELADLVLKETASSSSLIFRPLPGDDPKQRKPDITKARHLLSWEPKIPLREGLKKTVAYFSSLSFL